METALAFPEPLPEDPEVVATALETAGIFGVQGDVREALRWLRRAAEFAGDAGIDGRAFALARAAAELTTSLSDSPASAPPAATNTAVQRRVSAHADAAQAAAPPPPPPPPPVLAGNRTSETRPSQPHPPVSVSPIVSLSQSTPPAADNDNEAEAFSLDSPRRRLQPSDPALQAQPAEPASTAPSLDRPSAFFHSYSPAKTGAKGSAPSSARGQSLASHPPAPAPEAPPAGPSPALRRSSPSLKPVAQSPRVGNGAALRSSASPPDSAREAAALAPAQTAVAMAPRADSSVMESAEERPSSPPKESSRQAVRASIERSQESGRYVLRLLGNGEAPPPGTFEAIVVLTEPNAELFSDV